MSRKISIQQKKKWLELFEQGLTENQIAEKLHKDLRTIVSGLQAASRERHLANAEAEMLRNALFSHQDKLTNILKGMALMLVLPDLNLKIRIDEKGLFLSTPLSGSLLEQTPDTQMTLKIHDEEKLEWELLEEHLKTDKLWNYLKRWRIAVVAHMKARWQLFGFISLNFETETSLAFKKKGQRQSEFLEPIITDLFYEIAIAKLLGVKDGTDLEHTL